LARSQAEGLQGQLARLKAGLDFQVGGTVTMLNKVTGNR